MNDVRWIKSGQRLFKRVTRDESPLPPRVALLVDHRKGLPCRLQLTLHKRDMYKSIYTMHRLDLKLRGCMDRGTSMHVCSIVCHDLYATS
jgi:hypothetical protein